MLKVLKYSEFPGCCGVKVAAYFGYSTTNPNSNGPRDHDDLTADLKEITSYVSNGLCLVALTEEQTPHVGYLMKKYDFKPVVRGFLHPNHGKRITLYARVTHPDSKVKVGDLGYGENERAPDKAPRKRETPKKAPLKKFSGWSGTTGSYVRSVSPRPIPKTSKPTYW